MSLTLLTLLTSLTPSLCSHFSINRESVDNTTFTKIVPVWFILLVYFFNFFNSCYFSYFLDYTFLASLQGWKNLDSDVWSSLKWIQFFGGGWRQGNDWRSPTGAFGGSLLPPSATSTSTVPYRLSYHRPPPVLNFPFWDLWKNWRWHYFIIFWVHFWLFS